MPTRGSPLQPSAEGTLAAAISSMAYLSEVATGIAAIWRSDGVLQQWRTASGVAAAGDSFATALAAATATPSRQSARLLPARHSDDLAAWEKMAPVPSSLDAANKLVIWLLAAMHRTHPANKLPGSAAAHDLQWVMLVYTALLVRKMHQQQHGISPVQLYTAQPSSADSSSRSSRPSAAGSGTGSSSAGSSRAGSKKSISKQHSSKKASRAQQGSSSTSMLCKQHSSAVPPHHLEVLRAAGVEALDFNHWSKLTPGPLAGVLSCLLSELHSHQRVQRQTAAGAEAGTAIATTTGSNSSSSSSGGSSAAVLALLAPCALMWGEYPALHVGTDEQVETAAGVRGALGSTVVNMWQTSWMIQHSTSLLAVGQAGEVVQREPQGQQQQPEGQTGSLPVVLRQDSWYRSCVELIVPCLLHMRAAGTMDAGHYAATAKFCFATLEMLLITCLAAGGGESNCGSLRQGVNP